MAPSLSERTKTAEKLLDSVPQSLPDFQGIRARVYPLLAKSLRCKSITLATQDVHGLAMALSAYIDGKLDAVADGTAESDRLGSMTFELSGGRKVALHAPGRLIEALKQSKAAKIYVDAPDPNPATVSQRLRALYGHRPLDEYIGIPWSEWAALKEEVTQTAMAADPRYPDAVWVEGGPVHVVLAATGCATSGGRWFYPVIR